MRPDFDVIVGGGSVAGLAFSSEASRRGLSVLVLEEHPEVGEPEKCDGLVSLRGLKLFGHPPAPDVVQNGISSALITSPRGRRFAVNATALDVVVLDRSAYDKQLAEEAASAGSQVRTGSRVSSVSSTAEGVKVEAGESLSARYYVDATGPSSSPRSGILPAAKYEIEGDWVRERVVEVYPDASKYPGFFAWVIPFGNHRAKVGAAGRGVNPFKALDAFLSSRPSKILRRVSAPIYVGGPISSFVTRRRIFVGESAGQVKPTTAGGIMTSVAGAVAAARWCAESIKTDRPSALANYQREWDSRFLKEMRTMRRLRGLFERLSNQDLESLVDVMATPKLMLRLSQTDFDFHASALLAALGLPGLLRVARVVAATELRSVLA
ncbi:MAG: NAD(P)/FAD-dependent oxidoreductase [archaeon]|nr:MAG: NAD(P)/FAD-dependent oxidoreductase [archaeon]